MFEGLTDEQLIEEFEENQKRKGKKYVILFLTILSILLMLSYFYLGFPLFGIIAGQIESQRIQEGQLNLRGVTLQFLNETEQIVFKAYTNNPDVETSLCLEGQVMQDNYFVTNAYQPEIFSQSYTHVSHAPCSNETIALFHTHPYKSCLASEQDIQTLRRNQQENPAVIMVIMCEPDRFSVYR